MCLHSGESKMKKRLTTLLATLLATFIISSMAYASCNSYSDKGFKDCLFETMNAVKEAGKVPLICIPNAQGEGPHECPPLASQFSDDNAQCDNFISLDGKNGYGPWGKEVLNYLNEKGDHSLFMNNNLKGMSDGIRACPQWAVMSIEQKKHFWVWATASISYIESRCKVKARNHNGTNGVAAGLMQLDERQSMRSWRGSNCGVKNILDPKSNIRCGLDIMEELLQGSEGVYRTSGELWGPKSHSYWEHLRKKNGGGIAQLIKLHPYCNKY